MTATKLIYKFGPNDCRRELTAQQHELTALENQYGQMRRTLSQLLSSGGLRNEMLRVQAQNLLRSDPFDELEASFDEPADQQTELAESSMIHGESSSPDEASSTLVGIAFQAQTQQQVALRPQAQIEPSLSQSLASKLNLTPRRKQQAQALQVQRSVNFNPVNVQQSPVQSSYANVGESQYEQAAQRIPMSRDERAFMSSSTPPGAFSSQQFGSGRQIQSMARQTLGLRHQKAEFQLESRSLVSSQSIRRRLLPKQPAQASAMSGQLNQHAEEIAASKLDTCKLQTIATPVIGFDNDEQTIALRSQYYAVGRGSLGAGLPNSSHYSQAAEQLVSSSSFNPEFLPLAQQPMIASDEYRSSVGSSCEASIGRPDVGAPMSAVQVMMSRYELDDNSMAIEHQRHRLSEPESSLRYPSESELACLATKPAHSASISWNPDEIGQSRANSLTSSGSEISNQIQRQIQRFS